MTNTMIAKTAETTAKETKNKVDIIATFLRIEAPS